MAASASKCPGRLTSRAPTRPPSTPACLAIPSLPANQGSMAYIAEWHASLMTQAAYPPTRVMPKTRQIRASRPGTSGGRYAVGPVGIAKGSANFPNCTSDAAMACTPGPVGGST